MWTSGNLFIFGKEYFFDAKVYDEASKYGIKKGRISKLTVRNSEDILVLQYDRGWVQHAKDSKVEEEILKHLLSEFPKEKKHE